MKIAYEYSHLGGAEILQVRYPEIHEEIREVIGNVVAPRTKVSREKTMPGRKLYSPTAINKRFAAEFSSRGYRHLRNTYTLEIPNSDVAIRGAYKQVDFVKGKVLVEVQFGKYAFMFYDMAKFQYFSTNTRLRLG